MTENNNAEVEGLHLSTSEEAAQGQKYVNK